MGYVFVRLYEKWEVNACKNNRELHVQCTYKVNRIPPPLFNVNRAKISLYVPDRYCYVHFEIAEGGVSTANMHPQSLT